MNPSFDYESSMSPFYKGVMDTVVRQSDYRGIGCHGWEDTHPHGLHRQTSIGLGDSTINFRELAPPIVPCLKPEPIRLVEPKPLVPIDVSPRVSLLPENLLPSRPITDFAPPTPLYMPPELIAPLPPPPLWIPEPPPYNPAQQDFYGAPGMMNAAQQEFYGPPLTPYMDY